MRIRNVKNAKEIISSHKDLIIDNQENEFIDINSLFTNKNPIHIEIGMGKGKFIVALAKQNPNINYIGIERFDSIIVRALWKVIENPLNNLILLRTDAEDLSEIFPSNSIERIYLNFSDPWPKVRHEKRRLTHRYFLDIYKKLLIENGDLHFKTDNDELFLYSVESLKSYPMSITYSTRDLHNSDFSGNIMTEFEEKFSQRGISINMLTAKFKENNNG